MFSYFACRLIDTAQHTMTVCCCWAANSVSGLFSSSSFLSARKLPEARIIYFFFSHCQLRTACDFLFRWVLLVRLLHSRFLCACPTWTRYWRTDCVFTRTRYSRTDCVFTWTRPVLIVCLFTQSSCSGSVSDWLTNWHVTSVLCRLLPGTPYRSHLFQSA